MAMHHGYHEAKMIATIVGELPGREPRVVMHTGSAAAKALARKSGAGGLKRISVKLLLTQHEVKQKRPQARKIAGSEIPADLPTKDVEARALHALIDEVGLRCPDIAELTCRRVKRKQVRGGVPNLMMIGALLSQCLCWHQRAHDPPRSSVKDFRARSR